MEEVTIGFKSGRSVTFFVNDTETFIQKLRAGINNYSVVGWYSDPKSLINISAIEYILPTKSILDING